MQYKLTITTLDGEVLDTFSIVTSYDDEGEGEGADGSVILIKPEWAYGGSPSFASSSIVSALARALPKED